MTPSRPGITRPPAVHIVSQGECLASIACEAGLRWQLLWDHPRNAELRKLRKDPNILLPGDQVFVPEQHPRSERCQTGRSYRFVCQNAMQPLRLVILNEDGRPRSGVSYTISIDGVESSGTTDAQGVIARRCRPNALRGKLILRDQHQEVYDLLLGHLDPISVTTGIQARLNHLGFSCGAVDGVIGPRTRHAVRRFQATRGLAVTGEIDDPTRDALVDAHGS